MKSLAFRLWSGLKATSVYQTGELSRALLTNTKGMARRRFSRRSKPPLAWLKAGHYKRRRRREFLDFMNGILDTYGKEKEIHVILDNLNTHKPKNDRWLKSHPNGHFHFTPTHTSWLNQIECWFSILSRQALQGASFVDVKQLREAIDHFICAYNEQAAPFEWRQTEIKQQPLRDNIAYFCK